MDGGAGDGTALARLLRGAHRKPDFLSGGGGLVSGTAIALKAHDPGVRIVAVEPKSSPVLAGGPAGPSKIQGLNAGIIPRTYDASVVDARVSTATSDTASREAERYLKSVFMRSQKDSHLMSSLSASVTWLLVPPIPKREKVPPFFVGKFRLNARSWYSGTAPLLTGFRPSFFNSARVE